MQPKQRKLFISIYLQIIFNLWLILMPQLASAQEASQTPSQDASRVQNTNKKPDDDKGGSVPVIPLGLTWTDSYVRRIGYAGILAGNREGIGWGSLYIPTASVTGVVETLDTTAGQTGGVFAATLFQATFIYDHKLGA